MGINHVFDDNGIYIRNLANNGEKLGVGQYRFPHNFELVGKTLVIKADGKEYTLAFECRKNVLFNGVKLCYECEKLEHGMYGVRFGYNFAAIDMENDQAVIALEDGSVAAGGMNGAEAPKFAGDGMVGTNVRWILGVNRYIRQEFVAADKVKSAWTPSLDRVQENEYKAIKLRDSFFFVVSKSGDCKNADVPFFTRRVVLLEDYERCMCTGAIFGEGFEPITVCGYARFEDQ